MLNNNSISNQLFEDHIKIITASCNLAVSLLMGNLTGVVGQLSVMGATATDEIDLLIDRYKAVNEIKASIEQMTEDEVDLELEKLGN